MFIVCDLIFCGGFGFVRFGFGVAVSCLAIGLDLNVALCGVGDLRVEEIGLIGIRVC